MSDYLHITLTTGNHVVEFLPCTCPALVTNVTDTIKTRASGQSTQRSETSKEVTTGPLGSQSQDKRGTFPNPEPYPPPLPF